jgi:hypothetical protein
MARRALGLGLVVVAAGATVVEAATLQSSTDEFRLDFVPEGAEVCVVFPRLPPTLRCDDLAGVEVPSALGLRDFLYVRRAGQSYTLAHILQPGRIRSEVGPDLARQAIEVVRAMERADPVPSDTRFEHQRLGAVDVLRFDWVAPLDGAVGEAPSELATSTYLLMGAEAIHGLLVTAPPGLIEAARRDVEAALPGVRFRRSSPPSFLERFVYPAIPLAIAAIVIVGAIVILVRRSHLKERLEDGDLDVEP